MQFDLANTVMFGAGAILIYSAIKDVTPQQVVQSALSGQPVRPLTVLPGAPPQAPPLTNDSAPTDVPTTYYLTPYPTYTVTSV